MNKIIILDAGSGETYILDRHKGQSAENQVTAFCASRGISESNIQWMEGTGFVHIV
jgi:hypothetical protein